MGMRYVQLCLNDARFTAVEVDAKGEKRGWG